MTITLRSSKSTALTFNEMDGNFTDLDTRLDVVEANYIKTFNGLTATSNALTVTTANVTENTNLYFTNARARSAISITDSGGDGSLSYDSGTGVITFTGPSASDVRAHLSAGAGITFSGGVISVGNDQIKDTMIDFGTGANQISTADIPEQTNLYYTDGRVTTVINATSIAALNDVLSTTMDSPTDGFGLVYNSVSGKIELAELPGAAGGEANRGSNLGGANEIFAGKSGVALNFRTIDHGDNLTITQAANTLTINTVSSPEFGNLKINSEANTIENIATNSNIVLKPNGTGIVSIDGALTATGDITGILATAAQTNVTSLGTLTALQVDNININGNTISSTAGTDLNITPLAGQQIVLDSTIVVDAGVVTGATNITSTQINATTAVIDEITIVDNNITTNVSNADLVLVPNGTGVVSVSSNIDMNNSKIVNVTDPTSGQDAATKSYVDAQISSTDLTISTAGDSGSGSVSTSQTLTVSGTTDEVNTSVSGQTITIGLPNNVNISNDLTVGNALTVTGNLTVQGTTTTISANDLAVTDSKIQLAVGNESSDVIDIGFVGHYFNGVRIAHAGFFRDATDSKFKLFGDYGVEPDQPTIDTDDANFELADLQLRSLEIGDTDNPSMAIRGSRLETINSNQNIEIETSGTGIVDIGANVQLKAQSDLRFADSDSSNWVAFQAPATVSSNITWTLPSTDGSIGDALVTNGSGTLSFSTTSTTVTNDESTNAERLIYVGSATSGSLTAVTQDSGFTYNPSSGTVTATTFSGVATSAQYADVAENYLPDASYEPGTVVSIGGGAEVTLCGPDDFVAGVVSTDPAYLMNSKQEGGIPIALVGRVPVRVFGPVNKGERVFADLNGRACRSGDGQLVGIAIETNTDEGEKLVECLLKV
jgi:hypothetical protein